MADISEQREIERLASVYGNMEMEDGDEFLQVEALAPGSEEIGWALVGTITSEKSVRFSSFRDTMANIWRPVKGVAITELGNKRYMFQFYNVNDMKRVLEEGPWIFEQNLIVLARLRQGDLPLEVPLNKADFWLQIHDVRVGYFSMKSAIKIGNFVGKFIKLDEYNF
ncbi:unnamed protein product [Cuscuta europaea]|uniref:DUF4283 domain-containing protein n=1 Tax=Cuscuta europaea TaxID=41803 RepID=A0A9P1E6V3_CUSEU|nr:unnamed protein product [Cuscuta europaea]